MAESIVYDPPDCPETLSFTYMLLKAQQLLPMGVLGRQQLSSALLVAASPTFDLASLIRGSDSSLWNRRARWRCLKLAMHLVNFEELQ